MPELPEVETVRRILEPQLKGRRISGLTVNRPEIIAHPTADIFTHAVIGTVIARMGRRGKYLSLHLDTGNTILLHLRMTGQLLATPADFPAEKHTHLIFHLDDGTELRYLDTRRFGRFWLLQETEKDIWSGIQKLGPEPFDPQLTPAWLREKIGRSRRPVKECLLDQRTVAGIGNIYGDEILFAAKICPARPACSLREQEWQTLAAVIPAVLQKAVDDNRMTPEEYLKGRGKEYRNDPFLQVYGHEGDACPCCGAALKRIILSGRSSVYCPNCQPEQPIP